MRLTDLLGLLPKWREKGWEPIPCEQYAETWQRYGGSVATHPEVIRRLSQLAGIPVRYLGAIAGDGCQAAMPTWGRYLALSKKVLKQRGKKRLFDLGNAEIILPASPNTRVAMRFRADYVSEMNVPCIVGLERQPESIALLRPPEDYRGKFLYNHRRELKKFQAQGGRIVPVGQLTAAQLAEIYSRLFTLRWGFEAPGHTHLGEVFSLMQDFMTGVVLFVEDAPVATQVLYRAESPGWISIEFVNGGVDPAYEHLSPGSVLTFLNTQAAWDDARRLGKSLRYSFGRADRDYKMRWCSPTPVYRY